MVAVEVAEVVVVVVVAVLPIRATPAVRASLQVVEAVVVEAVAALVGLAAPAVLRAPHRVTARAVRPAMRRVQEAVAKGPSPVVAAPHRRPALRLPGPPLPAVAVVPLRREVAVAATLPVLLRPAGPAVDRSPTMPRRSRCLRHRNRMRYRR